jgi:hypoxanthine phosphoribosyltransferase
MAKKNKVKTKQLFYEDIFIAIENIAEKIKKENKKYNLGLVIPRGGLIPGGSLSYKLNIEDLIFPRIQLYKNETIKNQVIDKEKIFDVKDFNKIKNSKNLLIIDDLIDSGETIINIIFALHKANCLESKNIDIAVLYANLDSIQELKELSKFLNFNLNIYYYKEKEPIWYIFPWEKNLKRFYEEPDNDVGC